MAVTGGNATTALDLLRMEQRYRQSARAELGDLGWKLAERLRTMTDVDLTALIAELSKPPPAVKGATGDSIVTFIEARISEDEQAARLDCGDVHPQADVYHPDGHEDPRVLARCAALRALVEETQTEDWEQDDGQLNHRVIVLRFVAAIWREHEDYDPRWAA